MSIGGELETGTEIVEVRRVRWRYVKGGLRMVILLCAGRCLFLRCAACDDTASAVTDSIVGASTMRNYLGYR